jgi:hypothetical protein
MADVSRMGPEQIQATYDELAAKHRLFLAKHHVQLPNLLKSGQYTFEALTLVCLYRNLGKPVTKEELTNFVTRAAQKKTNDLQPRHLATQKGWNILLKQNKDEGTEDWPPASYGLMSVTEPKKYWVSANRNVALDDLEWESLLDRFSHRCATCGSVEGARNLRNPLAKTTLQRGHCDPNKPLTVNNCIPQCVECNRDSLAKWIWDKTGRPAALNDPKMILQSPEETQRQVFEILSEKFNQKKN